MHHYLPQIALILQLRAPHSLNYNHNPRLLTPSQGAISHISIRQSDTHRVREVLFLINWTAHRKISSRGKGVHFLAFFKRVKGAINTTCLSSGGELQWPGHNVEASDLYTKGRCSGRELDNRHPFKFDLSNLSSWLVTSHLLGDVRLVRWSSTSHSFI